MLQKAHEKRKWTKIVTFAFGILIYSCGSSPRQTTTSKPLNGIQQNANSNEGLNGQASDGSICVRNNCPIESNNDIRLVGDTTPKGLIGELNKKVNWQFLVVNDKKRVVAIALDPKKNTMNLTLKYPNESQKDLSKAQIVWTPAKEEEGEIHFVIRDISRCDALSKEELRHECTVMSKLSDFDSSVRVPFKVAKNLLVASTWNTGEQKTGEDSLKDKLISTAACAGTKILSGGFGETIGDFLGNIVNGVWGGGKDVCQSSSTQIFGSQSSGEVSAEVIAENKSLCSSLYSVGAGFGVKGDKCECSVLDTPSLAISKKAFVNSCLGLDPTASSTIIDCANIGISKFPGGCKCPSGNLIFTDSTTIEKFIYACFKKAS